MSNSGESKLPKILNALGTLAVLLATPIGFFYTLKGNLVLTALFTLVGVGALVFISQNLIKEKKKEYKYENERNVTKEYSLLAVYIVIALVLFPFMFHFISVDFFEKENLQKNGKDKLGNITAIFEKYEEIVEKEVDLFKSDAYNLAYRFFTTPQSGAKDTLETLFGKGVLGLEGFRKNNLDQEAEINKNLAEAIVDKQQKIRSTYDLGSLKPNAEKYVAETTNVFESWKHTRVAQAYGDVDNQIQKVLEAVEEKMPDFEYEMTETNELNLDKPLKSITNAQTKTLLIVGGLIIIFFIIILAEYFQEDRRKSLLIKKKKKNNTGIKI